VDAGRVGSIVGLVAQLGSFGSRAERVAYNEARSRKLNERNADSTEDGQPATGFRCECGHAECFELIPLSDTEWREVRSEPTRFAVVPRHVAVGVEVVTKQYPHVWFVEKRGRAGEVAEALD
jgi:hypothetical protein